MDTMKPGSILWLVITAILLASCSQQENIVRQDRAAEVHSYDNPHTMCARCHGSNEPDSEAPLFQPGVESSMVCRDCHKYAGKHHPVDFVPAATATGSLPLYRGRVSCLTCHQIHGGPLKEGTPGLLRGGPYADRRAICFICHRPEQYAEINPHLMRDAAGKIAVVNGKPVCQICHTNVPAPLKDREATVTFVADIGFLCWRCHPPMPGSFLQKHFLKSLTYEMLHYTKRPDVQEKFILPLGSGGRITCSTCHNPHQKGVIAYEPAAAGADSPNKIRNANLCEACHKM
jgi:hypothetical protein